MVRLLCRAVYVNYQHTNRAESGLIFVTPVSELVRTTFHQLLTFQKVWQEVVSDSAEILQNSLGVKSVATMAGYFARFYSPR